jgi:hypothetical protein
MKPNDQNIFVAEGGRLVGWVELREPHHCFSWILVGLAAIDPPYHFPERT